MSGSHIALHLKRQQSFLSFDILLYKFNFFENLGNHLPILKNFTFSSTLSIYYIHI